LESIGIFLREQRHLFGICPNPDCRHISRLTDILISYRGKDTIDWMDTIEKDRESWEDKISEYEEKGKEIRQESIALARKSELPKRLSNISPLFAMHKIQPDDIKVISHPTDFVGFDGLITEEDLRRIVLLDSKASTSFRKSVQTDIEKAVSNGHYDWNVLRVDDEGKIDLE
jgi:predicted Holliday junction resolvase-like endonuclease